MGDYHMDLKEKTELTDEELDLVVGGAKCYVDNKEVGYANVRSGPGIKYETEYSLNNGQSVYTTGYSVEIDGCCWYELDDGNWIQGNFIGY